MRSSTTSVRNLLEAFVRRGSAPGVQYASVDSSGLIHAEAAGLAEVTTGRPMLGTTTLLMYSMSKVVTAAAVVKLAEQGALAIDDPVCRFVPWQPYGSAITVQQLLTHTAGLPNPLPLRWVHPVSSHPGFDAQAALRRVIQAHPRPTSPPGSRFAYSNLGYWLLGEVVANAAGVGFEHYVRDQILAPLGIASAALGYQAADAAAQASGHLERFSLLGLLAPWLIDRELLGARSGRWVSIRGHYLDGAAYGGLVGTATGITPFLQDHLREEPRLWSRPARDRFMAPQRLARGPIPMTLGWHVEQGALGRVLYKEGGGFGFHCMMRVYPSAGLASVVLTNATASKVRGLLDQIDLQLAQGRDA